MNVLVVATRDPGGRRSGGRAVLLTILTTIAGLGHRVEVLVVSRVPLSSGAWPEGVRGRRVEGPGLPRVAANVVTGALTGRRCLNECLFYGPQQRRAVEEAAARLGADVVVADTVRAWGLVADLGLPAVLYLEDLLSLRYRRPPGPSYRRAPGPSYRLPLGAGHRRGDPAAASVLGYYRESLPGWMRPAADAVASRAVGVEAALAGRRERVAGRAAAVVATVSPVEGALLAARLGRPVSIASIAITDPSGAGPSGADGADGAGPSGADPKGPGPSGAATEPPGTPALAPAGDAVFFVGGLDYRPNVDALRWWVAHVAPALAARSPRPVVLHAFGHCPDAVREEMESDGLVLYGFVDDLAGATAGYPVFVAPVLARGGVKIKVVEAMGAGRCVVATSAAVDALDVTAGEHCLVADDPDTFASHVVTVLGDAGLAGQLGRAAQLLVRQRYSVEASAQQWEAMLEQARSSR